MKGLATAAGQQLLHRLAAEVPAGDALVAAADAAGLAPWSEQATVSEGSVSPGTTARCFLMALRRCLEYAATLGCVRWEDRGSIRKGSMDSKGGAEVARRTWWHPLVAARHLSDCHERAVPIERRSGPRRLRDHRRLCGGAPPPSRLPGAGDDRGLQAGPCGGCHRRSERSYSSRDRLSSGSCEVAR
jgi:hypothetical protein